MYEFKNRINIGIDIGSSSVKVVGIKLNNKSAKLKFFRIHDLFDENHSRNSEDTNISLLNNVLLELKHELGYKKSKLNVALSGENTFVYNLEIPEIAHDEIMRTIQWQLKSIAPWDINKVEMDYFPVPLPGNSEEQKKIILGVIDKNELSKYVHILNEEHFEPKIMEIDCLALFNCFEYFEGFIESEAVIVVNIGSLVSNCIAYHPNKNLYFRKLPFSGLSITKVIQENLNCTLSDAEYLKREIEMDVFAEEVDNQQKQRLDDSLDKSISAFCSDLDQFIKYFQSKEQIDKISKIYLTGGSVNFRKLILRIQEALFMPVSVWNPLKYLDTDCDEKSLDLIHKHQSQISVCLGAALRKD